MILVATALTVYGIETEQTTKVVTEYRTLQQLLPFTVLKLIATLKCGTIFKLQQLLPFTVLKLIISLYTPTFNISLVAIVLTVHGIETRQLNNQDYKELHKVATVLTVHGIETPSRKLERKRKRGVATVLTVHVIETLAFITSSDNRFCVATVLTVYGIETILHMDRMPHDYLQLQQCLPFTVLKLMLGNVDVLTI